MYGWVAAVDKWWEWEMFKRFDLWKLFAWGKPKALCLFGHWQKLLTPQPSTTHALEYPRAPELVHFIFCEMTPKLAPLPPAKRVPLKAKSWSELSQLPEMYTRRRNLSHQKWIDTPQSARACRQQLMLQHLAYPINDLVGFLNIASLGFWNIAVRWVKK